MFGVEYQDENSTSVSTNSFCWCQGGFCCTIQAAVTTYAIHHHRGDNGKACSPPHRDLMEIEKHVSSMWHPISRILSDPLSEFSTEAPCCF